MFVMLYFNYKLLITIRSYLICALFVIIPSIRYTSICDICLQNVFSDSLQCACCLSQVHQRHARSNDAFINSSDDDFYWNCKDCMELSFIFNMSDNNSLNVTLDACHCLSFCNEKVDPDINFKNTFNANTSYFTTEQFASTVYDVRGIFIIHIYCRSLYANLGK